MRPWWGVTVSRLVLMSPRSDQLPRRWSLVLRVWMNRSVLICSTGCLAMGLPSVPMRVFWGALGIAGLLRPVLVGGYVMAAVVACWSAMVVMVLTAVMVVLPGCSATGATAETH